MDGNLQIFFTLPSPHLWHTVANHPFYYAATVASLGLFTLWASPISTCLRLYGFTLLAGFLTVGVCFTCLGDLHRRFHCLKALYVDCTLGILIIFLIVAAILLSFLVLPLVFFNNVLNGRRLQVPLVRQILGLRI